MKLHLSFWRNLNLIYDLTKRDIFSRYRGSYIGILWSLLTPLFSLIVYTYVFSSIFKTQWNQNSESKVEFSLILFPGLIIFNLFSECISKSPSLILSNTSYVKKIVFPLEVLPWVSLGSSLFHFFVGLIVWLMAYSLYYGFPNVSVLLLPLVLIPFCFFILGISWFLSSMAVYLRDIQQLVGIILSILMFISPIFYPLNSVPEKYRNYFYLNPLAMPIEEMRNLLFFGDIANIKLFYIFEYWLFAGLIAVLGYICFQKLRRGFADVI
jgi:lipopolysaccharide transport system permease protein